MTHVKASKPFLFFQIFIKRLGIFAIYFYLLEAREFCTIVQLAKFMDALIGSWGLLTKLIARKIKNFEAFGMIFLIYFLQFFVLRRKSAFGSCIYNEEYFVSVFFQTYVVTFSVFDCKIVNCFHFI